jgi:triosephosphate isomerase
MRTTLIAGNWKMNLTCDEGHGLINEINKNHIPCDVWIFPPSIYLQHHILSFKDSPIKIGSQNVNEHESGAYTGEVSAKMLRDIDCKHILVGHSERREYYAETNGTCNKKIKSAHANDIHVIYCVGESLNERENGDTLKLISSQLKEGLKDVDLSKNLTIAYEPIWAIGTGKTATSDQAQDVHAHIRSELTRLSDESTANSIRILYGGSVKANNSKELLSKRDIDGALVGGASLKADEFVNIINNTQ